ncbi:hypothetical protein FRC11_014256 [Ceratobasidium sp. 423]|nr:hypothetical protein FRC11_014256 [Ceratobasidium sp. 423]
MGKYPLQSRKSTGGKAQRVVLPPIVDSDDEYDPNVPTQPVHFGTTPEQQVSAVKSTGKSLSRAHDAVLMMDTAANPRSLSDAR